MISVGAQLESILPQNSIDLVKCKHHKVHIIQANLESEMML